MLPSEELIRLTKRILQNGLESESAKIDQLRRLYTLQSCTDKPQLENNDWVYIFSETFPDTYLYGLPEVRKWLVKNIYEELDEISKTVLKRMWGERIFDAKHKR
jgi:hypothetical protein